MRALEAWLAPVLAGAVSGVLTAWATRRGLYVAWRAGAASRVCRVADTLEAARVRPPALLPGRPAVRARWGRGGAVDLLRRVAMWQGLPPPRPPRWMSTSGRAVFDLATTGDAWTMRFGLRFAHRFASSPPRGLPRAPRTGVAGVGLATAWQRDVPRGCPRFEGARTLAWQAGFDPAACVASAVFARTDKAIAAAAREDARRDGARVWIGAWPGHPGMRDVQWGVTGDAEGMRAWLGERLVARGVTGARTALVTLAPLSRRVGRVSLWRESAEADFQGEVTLRSPRRSRLRRAGGKSTLKRAE